MSSERLRLNIENEIRGNSTIRGITSSYPDTQTFEIFIPIEIFSNYRTYYMNEVYNAIDKSQNSKNVNRS